jgi:hypothetical protein
VANSLNTHVGPTYSAVGASGGYDHRQDEHGNTLVAQGGGKYKEAAKRGNVYSGVTAATGVAPGTALGTTAAYCLYNPVASGKNLIVQRVSMGLISGTMGAGTVWITSSAAADAVPTGTAITPRNRLVNSTSTAVATPLTTATVTTTAAKMIDVLCSLSEQVVATATGPTEVVTKDIDGEIVIPAGGYICLHATAAAGSSPLVVFAVTWEEESTTT